MRSVASPLLVGALECIPSGVVVVDEEGKAIVFNEAARQLTGLDKRDVVGRPCGNTLEWGQLLLAALETAMPGHCRKRLLSGSEGVEIFTAPVRDDNGSIIGAVATIHGGTAPHLDAGGEKQEDGGAQQRALGQTAGLRAPAADLRPIFTALDDVIMNVAHRMRSPLSAIQLFVELLKQDLAEDKQQVVDDILVGVHSLDAVLSNLLSLSQPVNPHFEEVDLVGVLDEALAFARPAVKQQGISLAKEYSRSRLCCCGDLEQLKQVCFNLILNAIQAMPEGGQLCINASHSDCMKHAVVEVGDTGCGIQDEHMDRIFTPFFTTKEGGIGLGLCIVYRVIQAHQGSISINSIWGHGTTVSIQLPTGAQSQNS